MYESGVRTFVFLVGLLFGALGSLAGCAPETPAPFELTHGEESRVSMWWYGWGKVAEGEYQDGVCDYCSSLEDGSVVMATIDECTFSAKVIGVCICGVAVIDPALVQPETHAECWCEVTANTPPTDPDCADTDYPETPPTAPGIGGDDIQPLI